MADPKQAPRTEAERQTAYIDATRRFSDAADWRTYLLLADEFRSLGTYKDAPRMYDKCIKAASAPAYRDVTAAITEAETLTAEDLWEAARILTRIQDFQDARETARVYTIKANALAYEEAVSLLSNADATTADMERGVCLLREIRTYRDARNLLDRFEKYYFERMYAEGSRLADDARVYSEFEEAAAIFERISTFSDAASRAAACRKRADKLRPRKKRAPKEAPPPAASDPDRMTVRPRRRAQDETQNAARDVLRSIDKRRIVAFAVWLCLFVAAIYASIALPRLGTAFTIRYGNEIRGITAILALFFAVMTVRAFLRMLTASMRKTLREAALRTLKKLVAPLVRIATKLLSTIGIDLGRKRLGGRDERSFVFHETEAEPKRRRRLKNDLKWQDQTDNASRIRFLFIDHMIERIRAGYAFKRTLTPTELGRDLSPEPDDQTLFELYNKARYARGGAKDEITDDMVDDLRARRS